MYWISLISFSFQKLILIFKISVSSCISYKDNYLYLVNNFMSFFQMLIPLLTAFTFNCSPSIILNFRDNYKHSCLNTYFNGNAFICKILFLNRKKEVRGGREGKVLRRKERTIKPRERDRKRNQKSEHRNVGLKHFKKTKSKTPFQLHFPRKRFCYQDPTCHTIGASCSFSSSLLTLGALLPWWHPHFHKDKDHGIHYSQRKE